MGLFHSAIGAFGKNGSRPPLPAARHANRPALNILGCTTLIAMPTSAQI
jgi:hypothetical protein